MDWFLHYIPSLKGFGSSGKMYYDTTLQEAFLRGLKCHSNDLPATCKESRLIAKYLHDEYNSVFYGKAQNLGRVLCRAYDEAFEKYDVLILPTSPIKAPVFPQQNVSLKGMLRVCTLRNCYLVLSKRKFWTLFVYKTTKKEVLWSYCGRRR